MTTFRTDFPKAIRSHIKMLAGRLDFLKKRIESAKAEGKPISWDDQERSALEWALSVVEGIRWKDALTTPAPEAVPLVVRLLDGREVLAKMEGGEYRDAASSQEIEAVQVVGWRVLDVLASGRA